MSVASDSRLRLSDAEYRMFCGLLRGHCGLCFDESSRFLVEKRLIRRLEALGLGSFSAYLYFLRNGREGDEELAQVIDILVTNETYFFREGKQLKALIRFIESPRTIREALHRLRSETRGDLGIWIGRENPIDELRPFSLLAGRFDLEGRAVGQAAL